jgi:hypothetical protein
MSINYEEKLKDELKKLVQSKVTVTKDLNNYLINISGNQIEIPLISNRVVRKNSITSR